ncbi:right-handed parallel beta-helix repeat-containing protein [Myxococcota bacterium]
MVPRTLLLVSGAALTFLWGAGCSESTDNGDGRDAVELPTIPRPPLIGNRVCPDRWSAEQTVLTTGEEFPHCSPPAQLSCANGEAQFLPASQCQPIGTPCPASFLEENEIRALAPDHLGDILYVRPGSVGGNGARTQPLATIAGALARTDTNDIIALSADPIPEAVVLSRNVAIVGACVAQTELTAPWPSEEDPVVLLDHAATLANLRVTGARAGIAVTSSSPVTISQVEVLGAQGWGVVFEQAAGTLSQVAIRDTESLPSELQFGPGLQVFGGQVSLEGVVIERNRSSSIVVSENGTTLIGHDVVVRDTRSREMDTSRGEGLVVQAGAAVEMTRAVFERNRSTGLMAALPGTSLTLNDVVIRQTAVDESSQEWGWGLHAQLGARVTINKAHLTGNHGAGIAAFGEGTQLIAADVTACDTLAEPGGSFGIGLAVQDGGAASVTRSLFCRNRDVGVLVAGPGVTAELTDVVVGDTQSQLASQEGGRGMTIQEGADAQLTRVLLTANKEAGLFVSNGGQLTATDLEVRDTGCTDLDGIGGMGLAVQDGAQVRVTRGLFIDNHSLGIAIAGPDAAADLTDITASRTHSEDENLHGATGLGIYYDAQATVTRALFAENHGVGVYGAGDINDPAIPAPRLVLDHVTVTHTARSECADLPEDHSLVCRTGDVIYGYGAGVVANLRSTIVVQHFDINASAQTGMQIANDATIYAEKGAIHGNPIGINVQVDGYDFDTLGDIELYDNGINLDSQEIPVPRPKDVYGP